MMLQKIWQRSWSGMTLRCGNRKKKSKCCWGWRERESRATHFSVAQFFYYTACCGDSQFEDNERRRLVVVDTIRISQPCTQPTRIDVSLAANQASSIYICAPSSRASIISLILQLVLFCFAARSIDLFPSATAPFNLTTEMAATEPASSCRTSPTIHVVDTVVVQPSSLSLQQGPASRETSLPLTYFDIFWLHSPPVERLLLYRLAPDADVDAIISTLKASLSEALGAFYPLAGRVRLTPGTADRYEIHYRPGDGVAFTVAVCDDDVEDLATHDAREVARIAPLIPPLPRDSAVLALQATLLAGAGRRGLAVGVAVHHAACDGAGSTHFLHTWAAAARLESVQPPPVIDRSLIPDPRGLYDIFYQARPSKDEMEFVKMSPDQLLATFVLSASDLQRVKDAVAAEAAARGTLPPPRCSSLVATLGLVWSSYLRAKKSRDTGGGEEGSGSTSSTCLLFSVDQRARMNPAVPDKYLGNVVGPAFAAASRADLATPGAGGLFTACAAVAAAIQDAVAEIGTPRVDSWMDRLREAGAMGVLSMAGSPRFRVYDLDFGFGRPAKVDIVSVARTGAVAVAESGSEEGGGGMEVGISLAPEGMDRFHECFADAVAWLRDDGGVADDDEQRRHLHA